MTQNNPEPSYVCGTGDKALIYKTIGQVFDETCTKYPDQPAIIVGHQNIELNYSELSKRVDIVSANLLKMGLQTGDRGRPGRRRLLGAVPNQVGRPGILLGGDDAGHYCLRDSPAPVAAPLRTGFGK